MTKCVKPYSLRYVLSRLVAPGLVLARDRVMKMAKGSRPMLRNKDITLLVIASAQGEGLSPVQLQKSLFLIRESGLSGLPDEFYTFVPYNYGPFNADVYNDADELVSEGMVNSVQKSGRTWCTYVISPEGIARASEIREQLPQQLNKHMQDVVDWVKALTFDALLRAIYAKYPGYRENSVFQD